MIKIEEIKIGDIVTIKQKVVAIDKESRCVAWDESNKNKNIYYTTRLWVNESSIDTLESLLQIGERVIATYEGYTQQLEIIGLEDNVAWCKWDNAPHPPCYHTYSLHSLKRIPT